MQHSNQRQKVLVLLYNAWGVNFDKTWNINVYMMSGIKWLVELLYQHQNETYFAAFKFAFL